MDLLSKNGEVGNGTNSNSVRGVLAWDAPLSPELRIGARRSPKALVPFLECHFGHRPIRILEIGVFRAGLSQAIRESSLSIKEYVGIDPYLGTGSDSYLGAYWSNKQEADALYRETSQKFNEWNFSLERAFSAPFLQHLATDRYFDFIYVDGDHRYLPALWDCCLALQRIEADGILGVDDYANSDTPEVTSAVNDFLRLNGKFIRRASMVEESFCNAGKFLPIVQRSVLLQPADRGDRLAITLPNSKMTKARAARDAVLDFNLRKVARMVAQIIRM